MRRVTHDWNRFIYFFISFSFSFSLEQYFKATFEKVCIIARVLLGFSLRDKFSCPVVFWSTYFFVNYHCPLNRCSVEAEHKNWIGKHLSDKKHLDLFLVRFSVFSSWDRMLLNFSKKVPLIAVWNSFKSAFGCKKWTRDGFFAVKLVMKSRHHRLYFTDVDFLLWLVTVNFFLFFQHIVWLWPDKSPASVEDIT